MNPSPDVERVLRAYLADDGDIAPDRVLEVVADRIARQPRRPASRLPWRPFMNGSVKIAAGLAALLIVAVVGYNLLPGQTGPGGPTIAPSPSAPPTVAPTAAATAAPTADATWPTWYPPAAVADANGAGILSAGSHSTRVFSPAFTFTAPSGWVNAYDEPGYFTLFPDSPANAARFAGVQDLAHHVFMGPQGDPWFTCETAENNSGATAAEIVAAITASEALAASGLVDVTIGGLSGKQLDVQRDPDWTGTCPGDASLPADVDPEDERTRAILLDVPGRSVYVIFMYSSSSAEHEAFLVDAMPIIESFEFDLAP
jgi:hypothetical protein